MHDSDDAYAIAQAGGKHSGMIERYDDMSTEQIEKSLKSFEENVAEHKNKLAAPETYVPGWERKDPREQEGILRYWQKDKERNREQANLARTYLEEHKRP